MSVDLLLSRLDRPRASGRDRWRAACPKCGEGNRSTLSIGIGESGCVLVKCWKSGCSPDEVAAAVALDIEDLFPRRDAAAPPLARRRLVSAAQALDLLNDEAALLWIVGSDWVRGKAPDQATLDRVISAVARIDFIRQELRA